MARKKKEANSPVVSLVQEYDNASILSLTEIELLKLRALEAEVSVFSNASHIKALQRELFLVKIDPEGKILAFTKEIQELQAQSELKRAQYREALAEIEARLNIKMGDFSFDDVTGVLHSNT
jgi:hypothetical protein